MKQAAMQENSAARGNAGARDQAVKLFRQIIESSPRAIRRGSTPRAGFRSWRRNFSDANTVSCPGDADDPALIGALLAMVTAIPLGAGQFGFGKTKTKTFTAGDFSMQYPDGGGWRLSSASPIKHS